MAKSSKIFSRKLLLKKKKCLYVFYSKAYYSYIISVAVLSYLNNKAMCVFIRCNRSKWASLTEVISSVFQAFNYKCDESERGTLVSCELIGVYFSHVGPFCLKLTKT